MSDIALALELAYGDFRLSLDTRLPGDGVIGIYGPSGSGKTSLLNCIAGLNRAQSNGRVTLGEDVLQDGQTWLPPHQRDVSCVFQDGRLFPHLDVAGNLQFAHKRRRREGPSMTEISQWLGLDELLSRYPAQLSRGQQQRVAIARALVSAPRLLLLDEPLANIDPAGTRDILGRLARLRRDLDMTMVYVSHDMAELAELADHLLVLSEGQLVAEGPLLELSSRLELALAHEEQAAAIVSAQIAEQDRQYGLTGLDFEGQRLWVNHVENSAGTAMRLRLPARDISLCRVTPEQTSILNVLQARIAEIEGGSGSRALVRLAVGEQFLLARVTRKSIDALQLAEDQDVFAQVKSVALLSDTRDE